MDQASPELVGRCVNQRFTEPELAVAYREALAVVMVADSRGLREAAAEAALRVQVDQPHQLVSLLHRSSPDLLGWSLLAAARVLAARRQGSTS